MSSTLMTRQETLICLSFYDRVYHFTGMFAFRQVLIDAR